MYFLGGRMDVEWKDLLVGFCVIVTMLLVLAGVLAQLDIWKPADPNTKNRLFVYALIPLLAFAFRIVDNHTGELSTQAETDQSSETHPTAENSLAVGVESEAEVESKDAPVKNDPLDNLTSETKVKDIEVSKETLDWAASVFGETPQMPNIVPRCERKMDLLISSNECIGYLDKFVKSDIQPAIDHALEYGARLKKQNDNLLKSPSIHNNEKLMYIQSELRRMHTYYAPDGEVGYLDELVRLRTDFNSAIRSCQIGDCPYRDQK